MRGPPCLRIDSMSQDQRIEQFKNMAQADPENELGHLSLGKAYFEAGQYEPATGSLARAIELNAKLSKAYQLLGEAFEKNGQRDQAVDILTRGVAIADGQGDRMPRDAMIQQLTAMGADVPDISTAAPVDTAAPPSGESAPGFKCSRCGRPNGQLEKRPFKGTLGEKIFANVCTACWKEWIPMGTKVINELGLTLSSPAGQTAYDEYLNEFLQLENR